MVKRGVLSRAQIRHLGQRKRLLVHEVASSSTGRSLPYIRDTPVLSKNTVGTHVRNLYKKLGVHSRQELLDLFEARER